MPPRKQLAREQLTREQIENLSITDFAKIKLSNEEIRIAREIADERENERLDRVRRLSVELEPLLNELRAVGLNLSNVGELIMRREPYPQAIPILLRHLTMPYSDAIIETIARSLAVREPEVRKAWPLLVARFRAAPTGRGLKAKGDKREYELGAKDGLACTLAVAVTNETLEELIELLKDSSQGDSRILLLSALKKSKDPRAKAAIDLLANDPVLAKEIASWRKRRT